MSQRRDGGRVAHSLQVREECLHHLVDRKTSAIALCGKPLVQRHSQQSNVHHPPRHSFSSHANFLGDALGLNVNSVVRN